MVGLGWVRARAGAADGAPLAGQPSPHARTTQRALCGPEQAPPRARIAARRASAQGTEQTLRPCPCAHAPKAISTLQMDGGRCGRPRARALARPSILITPFTVRASTRTSRGRPLLFCRRLSSAGSRPADDCVFTAVAARSLTTAVRGRVAHCRPFRPPKTNFTRSQLQ